MPTKYKVSPVVERTIDGIVFASKREAARYAQLKLAEKAGFIKNLELQPAYPVQINGEHYCTYTPDFRYIESETGKQIIEEVKSTGTMREAAYRLRKKAAELYYGIEVTVFIIGWDYMKTKLQIRKKRPKKNKRPQ